MTHAWLTQYACVRVVPYQATARDPCQSTPVADVTSPATFDRLHVRRPGGLRSDQDKLAGPNVPSVCVAKLQQTIAKDSAFPGVAERGPELRECGRPEPCVEVVERQASTLPCPARDGESCRARRFNRWRRTSSRTSSVARSRSGTARR